MTLPLFYHHVVYIRKVRAFFNLKLLFILYVGLIYKEQICFSARYNHSFVLNVIFILYVLRISLRQTPLSKFDSRNDLTHFRIDE